MTKMSEQNEISESLQAFIILFVIVGIMTITKSMTGLTTDARFPPMLYFYFFVGLNSLMAVVGIWAILKDIKNVKNKLLFSIFIITLLVCNINSLG